MQYYFIKLTKHFDYDSQKCQLLKLLTIMKILEPISLYPLRRHCKNMCFASVKNVAGQNHSGHIVFGNEC